MSKKRVLVCGATGFIGRNIAEALAEDPAYEVRGTYLKSKPFENPKVKLIQADLTNAAEVSRLVPGTDILIQAAATTSGAEDIVNKPYYHVTDNAVMNSVLFRAAFEHQVSHVVFFSCTVMYASGEKPVREVDFDANQEIYKKYFGVGWTKVYLEKMCEFYSRIGGTRYTVIRHSNIYGPHDKFDLERSHVFGATMTKVLTTRDGKVTVWGDGSEERDLLYISDLVDYVRLALAEQTSPFELQNVGLGSAISVADLVKRIIRHSGQEIHIEYDRSKPSLTTRLCLDISKAKAALGWSPQVSLDGGIRKTMDWYRENIRIER
jgi:nucleoside-diphosphate-sugar epimerase